MSWGPTLRSIAERRALVARSVDRVAGEQVRLAPMTAGGGYVAGVQDPNRPAFEIEATVSLTSSRKRREGVGATDAENLDARLQSARVSIAPAALGSNPPPERGWLVVLLERTGRPTWKVANLELPDAAHGRYILHLAKA